MLKAQGITVRLGEQTIVKNVDVSLQTGQWLMLVGPNGAGKSTLVSALSGTIPFEGSITVMGEDIRRLRPNQLARRMGVLSQHNSVEYAFTVEEVASMGRYAHGKGIFGVGDAEGDAVVARSLREVGLEDKRHQNMMTLSGGERQRGFLAQVFCQEPSILILDEPGNHLDLVYQKQLFGLIDAWRQTPGRAVVSVVHDLSLAKRFGSHALLLDEGECVAYGTCDKVLTRENLSRVWRMDVYDWMRELLSTWSAEEEEASHD